MGAELRGGPANRGWGGGPAAGVRLGGAAAAVAGSAGRYAGVGTRRAGRGAAPLRGCPSAGLAVAAAAVAAATAGGAGPGRASSLSRPGAGEGVPGRASRPGAGLAPAVWGQWLGGAWPRSPARPGPALRLARRLAWGPPLPLGWGWRALRAASFRPPSRGLAVRFGFVASLSPRPAVGWVVLGCDFVPRCTSRFCACPWWIKWLLAQGLKSQRPVSADVLSQDLCFLCHG